MKIEAGQLIGGVLSRKSNASVFTGFNPATGKALEPFFFDASEEEVEEAVKLANTAFTTYRNCTNQQRARFLETIAQNIEALGDTLLHKIAEETALPLARLIGERARTTGQLRLFAEWIKAGHWRNTIVDEALPDRKPLPRQDIRQMQVALGPVVVFGASNFPLAFSVAGGDTASALAAGCPVIFKAHPAHPVTCQLVGKAIVDAAASCGLPNGVFALLHGASHEVGMQLVSQPLVKAVAFTGSFKGGKAIYDVAVARREPIPVYAEMGSVNPVFFLPGAIRKGGTDLVKNFAASITLGTGQFCTNPGVFVLFTNKESSQFISELEEELASATLHPMLTYNMATAYRKGVQTLKWLAKGNATEEGDVRACVVTTDFIQVLEHPEYLEEVFGPVSVGVLVQTEQELLYLAEGLQGQLTCTVHAAGEDSQLAQDLIERLTYKAGRIVFNSFPTGVEVCRAMVHGGPFPATTDSRSTSVGTMAIYRFTRPVCFQNFSPELLADGLK